MWIEHYLTDVYGPRPIGSPNHKAAADWAVKTMTELGHEERASRAVHLARHRLAARTRDRLHHVAGESESQVRGGAVVAVDQRHGQRRSRQHRRAGDADRGRAHGVSRRARAEGEGRHRHGRRAAGRCRSTSTNAQKRTPDDQAQARYAPPDPNAPARGGRGGGPGGGGRGGRGGAPTPPPGRPSLGAAGQPAHRAVPSRQSAGASPHARRAAGASPASSSRRTAPARSTTTRRRSRRPSSCATTTTAASSASSRTARRCRSSSTSQNQYFPEGKTSYVTVGEIPGTDKADEVVMLGGHLDSWTSATGATDNAIGCAIMMEAARILADDRRQAAPHDSRRAVERRRRRPARIVRLREATLRIAPKRRCRTSTSSTPTGTSTTAPGRVRGASIFGPPEAAAILAQYLKPFEEWGVYGAIGVDGARRRRQRQRRVRRRRAAGHRRAAGSDRIQQHDLAHQSRHLRAHRARRRDEERGDHGVGRARHSPTATRCCRASRRPRCRRCRRSRRRRWSRRRGDAVPTRSRTSMRWRRTSPFTISAPGLMPAAAAAPARRSDRRPRSSTQPAHGKSRSKPTAASSTRRPRRSSAPTRSRTR